MAHEDSINVVAATSRIEEIQGKAQKPRRVDESHAREVVWNRDASLPVIGYSAGHTVRLPGDFQFAKVEFGLEVASQERETALNWIRSVVTYLRQRAVDEIGGADVPPVSVVAKPDCVTGIIFWAEIGLTLKDRVTGVFNKGNLSIRTPIGDSTVSEDIAGILNKSAEYMQQEHPWLTGEGVAPPPLVDAGL